METRFLTVDGGRIAYDDTETNAGPLVVCVPGYGENRTTYRHLRPLLTAAGYRVVTSDVRGGGESTVDWPAYDVTALAADIRALVRHLDAGPAVLVSNSFTGGASYVAAAAAPADFAALVLTGPLARPQPEPNMIFKLAESVVTHSSHLWMTYWSSLFKTTKPDDFAEAKKALAANMAEHGRMAALRTAFATSAEPAAEAAARVRCPVLVVMGSKDPDFHDPAAEATAVAELVADGTVAMIEGAGHFPSAEFPRVTADVVLNFLSRIAASAA
ncbi:MAG TPA: alpha/beta hydrolase [Pseudonocardiaceae bacterium]|nr:alpha/beta hydrolase [Pseudonocardiaceae bacterium]